MNRKRKWLFTVFFVLGLLLMTAPQPMYAQTGDRAEDGLPPTSIIGVYHTSYYASFSDWEIFPVLLPMMNARSAIPYEQRFDLRREGQITGLLRGEVQEGAFRIDLPPNPVDSAWFDTDGDPNTPSSVKLFVVGTGSGLIGTDFVSRYDFIYTRSFDFDPNSQLWDGSVVVWASEPGARLPILNGTDNIYYTDDDVSVTVPAGWSVIEVKSKPSIGSESVRLVQTSQPLIELREPTHLQDVDLSQLDYESAFLRLIDELERTYVFTDYRHVNWESLRELYAPKAAEVTNEREFQQLLESALFTFRDGHLAIIGAGIPEWMWGRLGIHVFPVQNELMVVEIFDHSPVADQSDILPGTIITAVNGQDALDYFNSVPRSIYSGGHESGD
ncbi:MAG TPA: hypothetical protein VJZ27_10615, partial [Aggregatilineales bacterium]|nr:hypothetical protein [Aggregatilineales bacterium]